jgi:hypothetical protein
MGNTIEKISLLLRKAESTNSPEEAEALIAGAQRLATLASVSLEVARSYVPVAERKEAPITRTIPIGTSGKKGLGTYVSLYLAIASVNDVKCNIAFNSSYVIAFGYPSDIDNVNALYASLVVQMVRESDAFIRSRVYRTEQKWSDVRNEYRPIHGHTARINFQEAYAYRIKCRLGDARKQAIQDVQEVSNPEYVGSADADSVALVLADKALAVNDYYTSKSRARGSWRGSSSSASSSSSTEAGRNAANRASLSPARALSGVKGALR